MHTCLFFSPVISVVSFPRRVHRGRVTDWSSSGGLIGSQSNKNKSDASERGRKASGGGKKGLNQSNLDTNIVWDSSGKNFPILGRVATCQTTWKILDKSSDFDSRNCNLNRKHIPIRLFLFLWGLDALMKPSTREQNQFCQEAAFSSSTLLFYHYSHRENSQSWPAFFFLLLLINNEKIPLLHHTGLFW